MRADAADEFHEKLADIMKFHFDGLERTKRNKKSNKKNAVKSPQKKQQAAR